MCVCVCVCVRECVCVSDCVCVCVSVSVCVCVWLVKVFVSVQSCSATQSNIIPCACAPPRHQILHAPQILSPTNSLAITHTILCPAPYLSTDNKHSHTNIMRTTIQLSNILLSICGDIAGGSTLQLCDTYDYTVSSIICQLMFEWVGNLGIEPHCTFS